MTEPQLVRLEVDTEVASVRVLLTGEIDVACEDLVVETIEQALDERVRRLVLDLTAVTFMDSSGLRAVLRSQNSAQERGVEFAVAAADGGPPARLFHLAGVTDWFDYE